MRNSIVRRLIGIVVAASMLLGMAGFAETGVRLEAKLNSPFAAFDGAVSTYLDSDFCNVILLEEASLGELLIQMGETLVFGNSETGYLQITQEAYEEALLILMVAIENELPMEEALRLYRYQTSKAYAEDMAFYNRFMEQTINQLAFIMMQKGAISIYENGDMELNITPENYQEIMQELVDQIFGDEETMEMLLSLNLWEVMGVSPEEVLAGLEPGTLPEMISELFAYDVEDVLLHGYLSAKGDLNVKASVREADTGLEKELVFYVDITGMGLSVTAKKEGFERVFKAFYIDDALTIDAWQNGGADNSYTLNALINEDGETKASGSMSMNGKMGAFTFDMTSLTLSLNAELTADASKLLIRCESNPFKGVQEIFVSCEKGEDYEEFYLTEESDDCNRISYVHKISGAVENELAVMSKGEGLMEIRAAWGGGDGMTMNALLERMDVYDMLNDVYKPSARLEGTVTAKGEEGYMRDFALNVNELEGIILFTYNTEGSAGYKDSVVLSLVEDGDNKTGTLQYHCEKMEDGHLMTAEANGKVLLKPGEISAEIKLESAADGSRNAPVEWKLYSSAGRTTVSLSAADGAALMDLTAYVVRGENEIGATLEGTLNGQEIYGDIGLESKGADFWTGYAGLTVDGVRNAVEIPVSVHANGDTLTVSAQLLLLSGEMCVELAEINAALTENENEVGLALTLDVNDGTALARYLDFTLKAEYLDEEYAHVTGENLSGEQLAQLLFELLGFSEAF